MALLQKIKEKLGFGGGSSGSDGGETTVTVEHEPDDTGEAESTEVDAGAAETDDAPVDADAGGEASEDADDGVDDAETEAANEDADGGVADAETEAANEEIESTDEEAEATDAETEPSDEEAEATDDDSEPTEATDGTPVDQITGIGPAYAERLGEIGIHTVEDLAEASAAEIADGTSVGEGRATTWIERATEF